MNRQQFSELVKDPRALGEGSITELEAILKQYPYCQTAQVLLTVNLLKQNHSLYQAQLKKAVAYAGDRKKLKELLEGKLQQPATDPVIAGAETMSVTIPAAAIPESLPVVDVTGTVPPVVISGIVPPAVIPDSVSSVVIPIEVHPLAGEETQARPEINILTPLTFQGTEPRQESYIEESLISSEELALASPIQAATPEKETVHPAVTLPLVNRKSEASLEKLTQDDLLTIVRKRLAEINEERKRKEPKPMPDDHLKEYDKGEPVLRPAAEFIRSKDELIEKFIKEEPQISRPKKEFFNPTSSSQRSNLDEEDIVSETLAQLYAKQGNLPKAIHIYEKLSLRFSEKSRYFAAQIEKLKGNTNQA
jgi:hypothetical protein